MSINSYLEETASNLIIKGNEKESIDVSLNTFKDRMRDYFSKYESVDLKEIKVFGSYQRDTNLPQSVISNLKLRQRLWMVDCIK